MNRIDLNGHCGEQVAASHPGSPMSSLEYLANQCPDSGGGGKNVGGIDTPKPLPPDFELVAPDEEELTVAGVVAFYLPEEYTGLYMAALLDQDGEGLNPELWEPMDLPLEFQGKGVGVHEMAWCADHGLEACALAFRFSMEAMDRANVMIDDLQEHSGLSASDASAVGNAYQHTYWMLKMAIVLDDDAVRELGVAHELDHTGEGPVEAAKDFYNNELGISLAAGAEDADVVLIPQSAMLCYQPGEGMYSC